MMIIAASAVQIAQKMLNISCEISQLKNKK